LALKNGINYEIFNLDKKDTIIFLHGWGSNKEIMKTFKDDFLEYKLLFIDLPGFGKSETNEVWTTQKYAQKIEKFLNELKIEKFCIIGHSFGGKVATLLNPKYLILLSSAGILEKKSLKVKFKIKLYKFLKPLINNKLKKIFISKDANEMSENMYQTFKNVVDENFSSNFKRCKSKTIVFGGELDTAVTPSSNKIISELTNSELIMLNGNHYFFLNEENKKIIVNKIKKLIKE
jgi:esterase/lipase